MKHKRDPEVMCPAGQVVHPVVSPNDADIHCRIVGHLQPAQQGPCCHSDRYVKCQIWCVELNNTRFLRGALNARPKSRRPKITKEIIGPSF